MIHLYLFPSPEGPRTIYTHHPILLLLFSLYKFRNSTARLDLQNSPMVLDNYSKNNVSNKVDTTLQP
jgi:hypothetical protein